MRTYSSSTGAGSTISVIEIVNVTKSHYKYDIRAYIIINKRKDSPFREIALYACGVATGLFDDNLGLFLENGNYTRHR